MKIQSPQIIGHRGHGTEPENTMRAFKSGLAAGADRVEFDIQKTKDGDYVVIHDPTVDRTTNGTGRVCDFTTADIEKLDAGQGEHLPLFSEVLDWAAKNSIALDIELKHPKAGEEKPLADMIRAAGLRDPWVMSFSGEFMDRFEKVAPEITTGVLVHERPLFDKAKLGAAIGLGTGVGTALLSGVSALPFAGIVTAGLVGGAYAGYRIEKEVLRHKDLDLNVDVHIPGKRILNKKLVERAHAQGKEVAAYTIDKKSLGEKMTRWGVDALITNFPELYKEPAKP